MGETKLTISEPTGKRQSLLNPKGATLGRGSNCDIILDHHSVSRLHARIYQDPFGRWIVEDLNSRNGVIVEGQPVKANVVLPGQEIGISHFTLSLFEDSDQQTTSGESIRTSISVIDKGLEEDIVPYKSDQQTILSPARMENLNEFTAEMMKLSSPAELYSHACVSLAEMLDTLVAIVRLPCPPENMPQSPEILACHFGKDVANATNLQVSNLHLSKRVLDAIRSENAPVMARSGPSAEKQLVLTVVDESSPHVVFSARVNEFDDKIDALYVDILEAKSAKEIFDFIEVVARQINFIQKNLFFNQLKKQEKELREANTQLKEKDRIKDEYVSRVTHDIKGHLTAIQSCLHIIADQSTGQLNERQSDFLNRSRRRTAQLSDFINELLNLTQMRLSGQFQTASFSLPATISKALDTVEIKAKEKSIALTSNVASSIDKIVGNQFSITEMVTNLTFNAIKYTPEGKTVHIEAKDCGDNVQIDIVDTGIGIPTDELGKVFDEFFRARNARESKKEGTGLGLSIVKQIVERHGGKISVQSREGQGTTFTVILPKGDYLTG